MTTCKFSLHHCDSSDLVASVLLIFTLVFFARLRAKILLMCAMTSFADIAHIFWIKSVFLSAGIELVRSGFPTRRHSKQIIFSIFCYEIQFGRREAQLWTTSFDADVYFYEQKEIRLHLLHLHRYTVAEHSYLFIVAKFVLY